MFAARFASESASSDYSDVTIYSHVISFKNAKFRFPGVETGLTPEGQAARGTAEGSYWSDVADTLIGLQVKRSYD